jgi:hypothetical protein
LKKQNELIGDWIRNDTEIAVAKTFSEKRIGSFDREDMAKLVEVMAKWRVLLGVNNDSSETELIVICQFVYDNFKKFTLSDVRLAMNWAVSGKIDMTFVSTKSISAMYVSKALHLYEDEKRAIVERIAHEKEVYERKMSNDTKIETSPEERANTFKSILVGLYEDYMQKGTFLDFGDFVYNWLKNNQIISPTKKDVQDALIYSERRYREQRMSEHNGLGLAKALEPKSEEFRKKKLAREYIIIKLFEAKELLDLIKLIKVEQFKK